MKKLNCLIFISLLLLVGCDSSQLNQLTPHSPVVDIPSEGETPTSKPLSLTPEILPIFDFRGIRIVGSYSEADLIEIMDYVQTINSDPITRMITPVQIQNQYYSGEILEVPNNIVVVFCGTWQGDTYTLEKMDGAWEIVSQDYWIR